jgi:mono/diheme cytochrome c family protein
MRSFVRFFTVALAVSSVTACTPLDDAMVAIFGRSMRDQRSFDPYENPAQPPGTSVPFSSGNEADALDDWNLGQAETLSWPQLTQANNVPIGVGDSLVQSLENPFERGDSAALARGQEVYMRVCWTCHGANGVGAEAPIADKHPTVPAYNLAGPQVAEYSDQYIYGMISVGRGLMPPWAHQIRPIDRWAVVTYVRQLQNQAAQGDE